MSLIKSINLNVFCKGCKNIVSLLVNRNCFFLRYGGKFGVQKDRMDKSAVDASYKAKLAAHASQTDAAKGFGGKFGVQKDRVDKVLYNSAFCMSVNAVGIISTTAILLVYKLLSCVPFMT